LYRNLSAGAHVGLPRLLFGKLENVGDVPDEMAN
jgi:hypothetical protein